MREDKPVKLRLATDEDPRVVFRTGGARLSAYLDYSVEDILKIEAPRPIQPTDYDTCWVAWLTNPDGSVAYPDLFGHLRILGVRIALDDFGSGYSSLNYVKDLPVDDLKIDKSFIDGLREDAVNDAIVRLIVDFAHTPGLKVTAEEVENDRQVSSLTAMGCDLAQGFYFSKPLPSEAARKLVTTNPLWRVPK